MIIVGITNLLVLYSATDLCYGGCLFWTESTFRVGGQLRIAPISTQLRDFAPIQIHARIVARALALNQTTTLYLCDCNTTNTLQWDGVNCTQRKTSPCEASGTPCLNGGACVRSMRGPGDCQCSVDWEGPNCSVYIHKVMPAIKMERPRRSEVVGFG